MFPSRQSVFAPGPLAPDSAPGPKRDLVWGRPVFRPPALPNPRVIFDPLPFTTQRLGGAPRSAAGR
ncbi:MAG: hypothetical protein HYX71_08475 [Opitutae bacterium]|nr:hypothetical protein [Opitutae bacterium]